MSEYSDLKKIVGILTETERKLELQSKDTRTDQNSLYRKLLKFLIDNPHASAIQTQEHVYGKEKPLAFNQLVHRSKEKLLDMFLLKDSLNSHPSYESNSRTVLQLRKQLIQYDILNLRGLDSISDTLIQKIISKAQLVESYDTLLLALHSRLRMILSKCSPREYAEFCNEIAHFEKCQLALQKSKLYVRRHSASINFNLNHLDTTKHLKSCIVELESDFAKTKSNKLLYNLLLLKAELYEIEEEYSRKSDVFRTMVSMFEANPNISTSFYLGVAYLNLGISRILLFDFEQAFISLVQSLEFMRNDINKFVVILHQFLLYYFSADKKQIEYYLDSINSFLYSGIIVNYYAALVRYYNACVKFIQSEYNASYLLLQDVKNLEQDKKSWNISIRILGIQNQIELENYELADSLIENLRKHYERIQKTMQVTKRDEAIIRILTSLSRHSYNFRKTYRLKLEAFNRLSSLEKGYRWKILSPEMILFHEWFLAKMNAGRYKHFELMPEVRKKYSSIYK